MTDELSTTPIALRDDDNRRRRDRLKKMKRGPGTFVYDGGHCSVEHHPTVLRHKREEPVIDEDGAVAVDARGAPIMRNVGDIVLDHKGKHMLGGPPKAVSIEHDSFKMWGVEFPRGVPVYVGDPSLALKLRCHGACRELGEDDESAEGDEQPAKRPRGRPRKQPLETEASED